MIHIEDRHHREQDGDVRIRIARMSIILGMSEGSAESLPCESMPMRRFGGIDSPEEDFGEQPDPLDSNGNKPGPYDLMPR